MIALGLLFVVGCTEEDTPTNTDQNETDVDPPYINSITGPIEAIIGSEVNFACDVASDADIDRYSWSFMAGTGDNSDYFYPADGTTEGLWTPSGEAPDPFTEQANGSAATYTYNNRGRFMATLEVEDSDDYIKRQGYMVSVLPDEPDTSVFPPIIRAGLTEDIDGEDLNFQRFYSSADDKALVSVFADSENVLHSFGYADNNDLHGDRIIVTRAEAGERLRVEGEGYFIMELTFDFDLNGAVHMWNPQAGDMVQISTYVTMNPLSEGGTPATAYLTDHAFFGSDGDQSYYFNGNHVVTDSVIVYASHEFEWQMMFGLETMQIVTGSDSSGSAVCFDGEDGFARLNSVSIFIDK